MRECPQEQDGYRFLSQQRSTLLSAEGFLPVHQTLPRQRAHIQTTSGSQTAPPGHDNDTIVVRLLADISVLWLCVANAPQKSGVVRPEPTPTRLMTFLLG